MIAALADRTACLLGNHGAITYGATVDGAYSRAVYLEWICEVYLRASAAGEPRLLSEEEIEKVRGKLELVRSPADTARTRPGKQDGRPFRNTWRRIAAPTVRADAGTP